MPLAHCRTCGQQREFEHRHERALGQPGTHMAGSEYFKCTACGETLTVGDGPPFPLKFLLDAPADDTPIGAAITDKRILFIAREQVAAMNAARLWLRMSPHHAAPAMIEARRAALQEAVRLLARNGYSVVFTGLPAGEPATIAEG